MIGVGDKSPYSLRHDFFAKSLFAPSKINFWPRHLLIVLNIPKHGNRHGRTDHSYIICMSFALMRVKLRIMRN